MWPRVRCAEGRPGRRRGPESAPGEGGVKTGAAVDAVAASLDPSVGSFEVALLETESFGCATFLVYVT